MAHYYGIPGQSCLFSGTQFGEAVSAIPHATDMHSASLDARVAGYLFRNDPPDYNTITMHDLMSFFDSDATRPAGGVSTNATEALNQPSSVSIAEDSKWKSIEEYTDTFRTTAPPALHGILACIGVPPAKFRWCSTSADLVDALFSELITRAFPNLDVDVEGVPRDVEQDILKIKNFVWMYEMSGVRIGDEGVGIGEVKVPEAHVVGRFTTISRIVHCLGMKDIQSIAQSLRCAVIGQTASQLANELLVSLGYQAMHQGNDLASALQAVQGYRVPTAKGVEMARM